MEEFLVFVDDSKHRIPDELYSKIMKCVSDSLIIRCGDNEYYFRKGVLHREEDEGPAHVTYHQGTLKPRYEVWYNDGVLHRENGPAEIWYYRSGRIEFEQWYRIGVLHRFEDPSKIYYYQDGKVWFKEWNLYGEIHRENGPAFVKYNDQGLIEQESWYIHGTPYRGGGLPYRISYSENYKNTF